MVSVFDTGISVNQSVLIYSWNEGFKQCLFSTAALCCIKSVCLSSLNPIGKQQGTYNILISLQPVGSAVQCQSAAQCNHANMSTKSCASEHSWIYQTIRSWLRSGQVRSGQLLDPCQLFIFTALGCHCCWVTFYGTMWCLEAHCFSYSLT